MKVHKGLLLSDQKLMFENVFVWDLENGERPTREKYKKWILGFFKEEHIKRYIDNMLYDIALSILDEEFKELNESYARQISFLQTLLK